MTESHSADYRGGEEGQCVRRVQIWQLSAPKLLTAQNQLMLPQPELLFAVRDQARAQNPSGLKLRYRADRWSGQPSFSHRKRFDLSTFLLPPFVTHLHPAPPLRFSLRLHDTSILLFMLVLELDCLLLTSLRAHMWKGRWGLLTLPLVFYVMYETHVEGQEPPRTEPYHQIKRATRFRSNLSVFHESKLGLMLLLKNSFHIFDVLYCLYTFTTLHHYLREL